MAKKKEVEVIPEKVKAEVTKPKIIGGSVIFDESKDYPQGKK